MRRQRLLTSVSLVVAIWSSAEGSCVRAESRGAGAVLREQVAGAPAGCAAIGGVGPPPELQPSSDGSLLWRPRHGERIECSGPAVESRQLECKSPSCEPGVPVRVALEPARTLRVKNPGSGEILVEVRSVPEDDGRSGHVSELVFARLLAHETEGTLSISRKDRMIRFRRGGDSPVTVPIRASDKVVELDVPVFRPGAELVARLPTGRQVAPVAYLLERNGVRRELEPSASGWLLAPALPAGEVRILPKYEGGMLGHPIATALFEGETTELLPLQIAPVAALQYAISPELCPAMEPVPILRLARLTGNERSSSSSVIWQAPAGESGCQRTVAGLEPGSYELSLISADGQGLSRTESNLTADEIGTAWLEPAAARLTGRVSTAAGEVLPDVWIRLAAQAMEFASRTDASGEYALEAPPGQYGLSVGSSRYVSVYSAPIRLRAGSQTHDVQIEGGVLEVQLVTEDHSAIEEPILIEVRREGQPPMSGPILPSELDEIRFIGLEPGAYSVAATGRSGWSTNQPEHVEISEDDPFASVELVLRKRAYEVHVVDTSSRPVVGAQVVIGNAHAEEISPGVYRPGLFQAGSTIRVIPLLGLAPTCLVAGAEKTREVVLEEATYSAWVPWPDPSPPGYAIVTGIPGSECGLGLPLSRARMHPGWVEIIGLPAGELSFALGSGDDVVRSVVVVPTPPPLLSEAPESE